MLPEFKPPQPSDFEPTLSAHLEPIRSRSDSDTKEPRLPSMVASKSEELEESKVGACASQYAQVVLMAADMLQMDTWILNELKLAESPDTNKLPLRPPSSLEVTVLLPITAAQPRGVGVAPSIPPPRNFAVTPDASRSRDLMSPEGGMSSPTPSGMPGPLVGSSRRIEMEPIRLPTPRMKSATSATSLTPEVSTPSRGPKFAPLNMKKSHSNVDLVPRAGPRGKPLSKQHSLSQVRSQLARVSLSSQPSGLGRLEGAGLARADKPEVETSSCSSSGSSSPLLISQRRPSRASLADQPSSPGEGEVSRVTNSCIGRVRHTLWCLL